MLCGGLGLGASALCPCPRALCFDILFARIARVWWPSSPVKRRTRRNRHRKIWHAKPQPVPRPDRAPIVRLLIVDDPLDVKYFVERRPHRCPGNHLRQEHHPALGQQQQQHKRLPPNGWERRVLVDSPGRPNPQQSCWPGSNSTSLMLPLRLT